MHKIKGQIFLSVSLLLLIACKKDNNRTSSIIINGTKYSTVKIGKKIWTSINYNGPGGQDYNGETNNTGYGKLYSLVEAKAIAANLPDGWRLPTLDDYNDLLLQVGPTTKRYINTQSLKPEDSYKLMSKEGWTYTIGNDSIGFNAYPAGARGGTSKGTYAFFWTSTPSTGRSTESEYGAQYIFYISSTRYDRTLEVTNYASTSWDNDPNLETYSIRFVKDN
jgi:uncharacterized protein (TIGR02145 family)